MTRTDWLLVLQGCGVTAQMLNAGVTVLTHNAAIALVICAVIGGFQFVVQHLGNKTNPNAPAQDSEPSNK